jgi:hypothetical protein
LLLLLLLLLLVKLLEEQLGLVVRQEVLTEDRLFSIDVAVEWQGRCVAQH